MGTSPTKLDQPEYYKPVVVKEAPDGAGGHIIQQSAKFEAALQSVQIPTRDPYGLQTNW